MLRYAITGGRAAQLGPAERLERFRSDVQRWSADGIDFIQVREKTLAAGELFELCSALVRELAHLQSRTRLLVNSRADIALASAAHGVHLTSGDGQFTPEQIREIYRRANGAEPVISASCHTLGDILRTRDRGASLILFGPVFGKFENGKTVQEGTGLDRLAEAVDAAGNIPVLALGDVTHANASQCLAKGAAGVAGIRLFHAGYVGECEAALTKRGDSPLRSE